MNSLSFGLGLSNNLRFIKSELVVCVQTVCGWEVGHVAVAYHRFVLFHHGFKCFTRFSNIFGIASFARELVDHARLRFQGDGVFGFHQGSSEAGRRFVCHFDVVASEVSG